MKLLHLWPKSYYNCDHYYICDQNRITIVSIITFVPLLHLWPLHASWVKLISPILIVLLHFVVSFAINFIGESGLGKSTLVESLFLTEIYDDTNLSPAIGK